MNRSQENTNNLDLVIIISSIFGGFTLLVCFFFWCVWHSRRQRQANYVTSQNYTYSRFATQAQETPYQSVYQGSESPLPSSFKSGSSYYSDIVPVSAPASISIISTTPKDSPFQPKSFGSK